MANEITVTIVGPTTVTLNDHSAGAPSYLLRNTPKLLSTLTTRRTETERQGEHGVYDSLSFYGPRTIPFEGMILGSSQADRKTKELDLKRALSLPSLQNYTSATGYVLVQFTDEDGAELQLYAKVADPPSFDVVDNNDPSLRSFGFVMVASDPRLYSQTLQSATGPETLYHTNFMVVEGSSPTVPFQLYSQTFESCTCTNAGSFGAPAIITIDGPTESPVVTNTRTGKFIHLDGLTLLAGQSAVINTAAHSVVDQDGNDLSAYWGVGSTFWVLEPGDNDITLIDDSSSVLSGQLTVEWRDTYI